MADETGLTPNEKNRVSEKLGAKASSLGGAVCRLYLAHPKGTNWHYTGMWGTIHLIIDRDHPAKPKKLRLYELQNLELVFEQELYEGITCQLLNQTFVAFEGDNRLIGLNFANHEMAESFSSKIKQYSPPKREASLGPRQSETSTKPKNMMDKLKAWAFGRGRTGSGEEMKISGPTNFQHKQHIGYDKETGFKLDDIPEQWKSFFRQAGVRKKDLKNPETAKYLLTTIQDHAGAYQQQEEAPPQEEQQPEYDVGANAPPAPAPPPLPSDEPAAAAPAPLNTEEAGDVPAPPSNASTPSDGGFLAQIQNRQFQLKSKQQQPEKKEGELVDLSKLDKKQTNDLAAVVANAIALRREKISSNKEEENESDSDWSD